MKGKEQGVLTRRLLGPGRRHRPLDVSGRHRLLGNARMMRAAASSTVAAPSRSRRGSSMLNSRSRAARMRTAIRESRPSSAKAVAGVMRVGECPVTAAMW